MYMLMKYRQECARYSRSAEKEYKVTLKMTLKAKNLLIEEYPLASTDVTFEDGNWWLKTTVKDLAGVGRFPLGCLIRQPWWTLLNWLNMSKSI